MGTRAMVDVHARAVRFKTENLRLTVFYLRQYRAAAWSRDCVEIDGVCCVAFLGMFPAAVCMRIFRFAAICKSSGVRRKMR